MTFIRIKPQIFKSSDGFTVQVRDRFTMEYVDETITATIVVDFGPDTTCLYTERLIPLDTIGKPLQINDEQKNRIVERIASALRFDGSLVELSGY